jgi:hypothetical protein
MRKIAVGTAAGIVAWLGVALNAQAQADIEPTGPQLVVRTQTSSTYTAVVTCNYNFTLLLRVYKNGVQKHYSNTFCANSGPTYNFSKVVNMSGWGLNVGDTLVYRGRVTVGGVYDQEDWTVIVSGSTTYLEPGRPWERLLDRDREEWA